jgi:hypothetical protein
MTRYVRLLWLECNRDIQWQLVCIKQSLGDVSESAYSYATVTAAHTRAFSAAAAVLALYTFIIYTLSAKVDRHFRVLMAASAFVRRIIRCLRSYGGCYSTRPQGRASGAPALIGIDMDGPGFSVN